MPAQGNALGHRKYRGQSPERAASSCRAHSGLCLFFAQTQGVALGWLGSHRWCFRGISHSKCMAAFRKSCGLNQLLRGFTGIVLRLEVLFFVRYVVSRVVAFYKT